MRPIVNMNVSEAITAPDQAFSRKEISLNQRAGSTSSSYRNSMQIQELPQWGVIEG